MDSKEFEKYLMSLRACSPAMSWASGKSWREVYDTCHRGGWLLWLYCRTNRFDNRKYVLAKASCAMHIKHLVPQSFQDAIDVAIKYGNGEGTDEEIDVLYRKLIDEQVKLLATGGIANAVGTEAVISMLRNSKTFTSIWDITLAACESGDVKVIEVSNMMARIVREVLAFEDFEL